MNTLTLEKRPNQITITFSTGKPLANFMKALLLFLIVANVVLALGVVVICFIEGFKYFLGILFPILLGFYFLRMYLWNLYGKEIISIGNGHFKKWNDFKYFKSVAYDNEFENIEYFILVDQQRKEYQSSDTLDTPISEHKEKDVTISFLLQLGKDELEVLCSTTVSSEKVKNVLDEVIDFLH